VALARTVAALAPTPASAARRPQGSPSLALKPVVWQRWQSAFFASPFFSSVANACACGESAHSPCSFAWQLWQAAAHVVAQLEQLPLAASALREQRLPLGHRGLSNCGLAACRDQRQALGERELQRVLRVVALEADGLEARLGELGRLVRPRRARDSSRTARRAARLALGGVEAAGLPKPTVWHFRHSG
jgi:hypothetical protein